MSDSDEFPDVPYVDPQRHDIIVNTPSERIGGVVWQLVHDMLAPSLSHLCLVHSFTDKRHPVLDEPPLPDGSNIPEGSHLVRAFLWYRRWLEWLHYKYLIRIDEATRVFLETERSGNYTVVEDAYRIDYELSCIDGESKHMLNRSRFLVPILSGFNSKFDHADGLAWMHEFRCDAMRAFTEIERVIGHRLSWTTFPLREVNDAYTKMERIHAILLTCLGTEAEFERAMNLWHVEDMLMSKRIFLMSDRDAGLMMPGEMNRLYDKWFPDMLYLIRRMDTRNRTNYDYRRLREWGVGRPWRKLYVLVDANLPGFPPNMIQEMRNKFTNGGWLSEGLLDVIPLETQTFTPEDRCMICLEEWQASAVVLRTRCDHYFHVKCIMEEWDGEGVGKFSWRCPLCRQSPGDLRQRASFRPEMAEDDFPNEFMEAEIEAQARIADAAWLTNYHGDPNLTLDSWVCLGYEIRRDIWRTSMRETKRQGHGVFP